MTEVVEKAGILKDRTAGATILTFAPEPEAATLFERRREIKQDDVYVVCVACGGTVVCLDQFSLGMRREPLVRRAILMKVALFHLLLRNNKQE